jgi:ubiquinone/menaquinone biosynthesis C-methylase UbiE
MGDGSVRGDAEASQQDFRTKYVKTHALTRALLAGFFGAIEKQLAGLEMSSALEVASGEGFSTEQLRHRLPPGVALQASELEPRLLAEARRRVPKVPLARESIYHLARADRSVDLVLALEVLEHLESPRAALRELCRVSRRWVIVSVPREPLWRVLNLVRLAYLKRLGNTPGHLQHWSSAGFARLVSEVADVREIRRPLPWTVILAEVRDR